MTLSSSARIESATSGADVDEFLDAARARRCCSKRAIIAAAALGAGTAAGTAAGRGTAVGAETPSRRRRFAASLSARQRGSPCVAPQWDDHVLHSDAGMSQT